MILLEKSAQDHLGRVRFAPMPDETTRSLELNAIPQIATGTILHSDGKKTYQFLANLNTIVGKTKEILFQRTKSCNKTISNLSLPRIT